MLSAALLVGLSFQVAQNPSPMTEDTRTHDRISQSAQRGKRGGRALVIGTPGAQSPIILHFHGDTWIPEQSVATAYADATIIAIQVGSGSDVYQDAMKTPEAFQALITE